MILRVEGRIYRRMLTDNFSGDCKRCPFSPRNIDSPVTNIALRRKTCYETVVNMMGGRGCAGAHYDYTWEPKP